MSDATLVRCCAPTLAGMKTGSVFTCAYDRRSTLRSELTQLNRELGSRGLRILPLRFRESHALVYLFRPDALARDLRRSRARAILAEAGYESTECSACIRRLICRLHSEAEFPHEIGLFLGYPPEDVRGFIENRARNCKLVGDWKVYGDVERARRIFARYKKCTQCYCRALDAGTALRELAVATKGKDVSDE